MIEKLTHRNKYGVLSGAAGPYSIEKHQSELYIWRKRAEEAYDESVSIEIEDLARFFGVLAELYPTEFAQALESPHD